MKTNHTMVRWQCAMLSVACIMAAPFTRAQQFDPELMKQSSVTFIGTVLQRNTVSFEGFPRSEQTATVRAEQVLEKPIAIFFRNGDTVTVLLNDPASLPEGTRATFYTDGWFVGRAVALKEIGHTLMKAEDTGAAIPQAYAAARQQVRDEELRARIASAAIVVHARVLSVRSAERPQPFVTEHDPEWQEAVVQVRTAVKGADVGEKIIVRFSGSNDVAFYRWPKLKVGEEHIILAVKDTVSGLPRAMLAGKPTEAYLVSSAAELLPKEELERVRRVAK